MSKLNPATKRLNLSIPSEQYQELLYVARTLGVSASSLVVQLMGDSVHHMATIMRQVKPGEATASTVRRLRGESIGYIQEQYHHLLTELDQGLSNDR